MRTQKIYSILAEFDYRKLKRHISELRNHAAILGEQKLSTKSLNYLNSIRAIMAEIPQIHQSRLK